MAMTRFLAFFLLVVAAGFAFAASPSPIKLDPLPQPLTSNAVAVLKSGNALQFFSFMGMGAKKTWDAVTTATYLLDPETGKWSAGRPVPGTAGRLGASAVGVRAHIFLLGGYVLDSRGAETTVSDVNVYEPPSNRWYRGEDLPVAVSAAVIGSYRDRYIYLIGGWSKDGPVQKVQVYDAEKNKWLEGTPMAGPAVFGHAGGIVDDTIIYVDGAYRNTSGNGPRYAASDACWMGKIDHKDPSKIQWSKLPAHPGPARYHIAAGASEKDGKAYFSGGSDKLYATNGVDFEGHPATPVAVTFAYNVRASKWESIDEAVASPSMDQRGLLVISHGLVLAGGIGKDGEVLTGVTVLPKDVKAP
jgi:N-acetylneuraminic acid mutarotase